MRQTLSMWLLAMFILVLGACSNGDAKQEEGDAASKEETTEQTEETKEDGEVTEVVFWHAMGGDTQVTLEEIVEEFNKENPGIEVNPQYQGTYDESITKFRSVGGSKDAPTIVQTYEIGTKYMIDSGFVEPVQTFIDEDNYDISQLEENIINYYTVDDTMYSMPFNSSTPVLIYNKDAFAEVGLEADKPPRTFNEIKEAAEKLTKKDGENVERAGFSMLNNGWFFEQLVYTQGGYYVDQENGRSGEPTKATFNGEEGQRVFNWLNEMNEAGTYGNFGSNWDDIRAAFQAEKTAMYLDSSAGVRGIVDNAPFEVGVAYIPHPDEVDPQGVAIGGASLWMSSGIEKAEQEAAWEFMKYLQTPEVQAKWHVETGYFAINPTAYDEQIVQKEYEKYPQLKVTVNQLQDTTSTKATQGALISVFPESRKQVVTALEKLYEGEDPQAALDEAAKQTDRAIEVAERSNK
ncbi:ABC transporter substrate-binding protein [Pontibacillus litoralis]|uniref:Glycerol-3-phosphate ABC transporter substrate-binding protein n=1 Tax=Pontibacillus litoralis JSM 072002 TaxID=1385512 RepID=A0A0A5HRI0_9BACI|nr:ABC transporter substrate-binding protein [Pontibacillus litoralis]KGX86237.1 glycerol-3-phosphate ABC transporter substrate-binding protein [Pontibacillus litoralis JSM 072002]